MTILEKKHLKKKFLEKVENMGPIKCKGGPPIQIGIFEEVRIFPSVKEVGTKTDSQWFQSIIF